MLIDHPEEKIDATGPLPGLETELFDHVLMQGEQFNQHVLRTQAGIRVGGSASGVDEGKDIVHRKMEK